jgi:hypothetical protein
MRTSRAMLAGLTAATVAAGTLAVAGPAIGSGGGVAAGAKAKIANALSAAPAAVAKKAAVMDWPSAHGGEMTMLRKGSNGFTCIPDDPMTPTNDPQCLNAGGMAWMDAWMMKTKPALTAPGLAYVLQGCTVASNKDPFAMEPAKGKDWVETGPHVMVFPTGKLDRKAYGTNPSAGLPYIRWAGTPYEHLVVPVPAP